MAKPGEGQIVKELEYEGVTGPGSPQALNHEVMAVISQRKTERDLPGENF